MGFYVLALEYGVERLDELPLSLRLRFQASRASTRVLQVVDFLFEKPVLTIQQVADKLGVYFPSAQHYVEQLEQAGILREITGQTRNRLYRADEILLTIDAPLEAHSKDYKGPVYLTAPCTKTPIIWI